MIILNQTLNYLDLSSLITKHFKPNLNTNFFLTEDESKYLLENKKLFYLEDNNLFLFKKRAADYLCYYYISDFSDSSILNTTFETITEPVVVEIPYKSSNTKISNVLDFFDNLGFKTILCRERYKISALDNSSSLDSNICYAKEEDLSTISKILNTTYNIHTGCVPEDNLLLKDITNQKIIISKFDNEIVGILHFENSPKKAEIRHIVVLEEYRNKNIASSLIDFYHSIIQNKANAVVWVSKDNLIAKKLYEKKGYLKDSFSSYVLMKG